MDEIIIEEDQLNRNDIQSLEGDASHPKASIEVAPSPGEAPPATPDQFLLKHHPIAAEASYDSMTTTTSITTPLMDTPISKRNERSSYDENDNESSSHLATAATPTDTIHRNNDDDNDDDIIDITSHSTGTAAINTTTTSILKQQLHIITHQRDIFQQELQHTVMMCEDILTRERDECNRVVQHATDIACGLRDENISLMTENDILKSRIEELESAIIGMKREYKHSHHHHSHHQQTTDADQSAPYQEGNEQLIAALQVEIADKERQLYKANKARSAAEEALDAMSQRAEMLAQQVQHLVGLLDQEREEKNRCVAALQAAGVLPSLQA